MVTEQLIGKRTCSSLLMSCRLTDWLIGVCALVHVCLCGSIALRQTMSSRCTKHSTLGMSVCLSFCVAASCHDAHLHHSHAHEFDGAGDSDDEQSHRVHELFQVACR